MATTATATQTVQNDILSQLGIAQAHRIVTGFNRPNLVFEVRQAPTESDKQRALRTLLTPQDIYSPPASAIIYVGTRREAESVAQFVRETVQVRSVTYHGGLEAEARSQVQDEWIAGRAPVVVATNAFGMGVDKPDVRLVIHWTIPGTLEAYYQEAGRAGRDGLPARCVILYSPEDRTLQEFFIDNDAPTEPEMRTLWEHLKRQMDPNAPLAPIRVTSYELERASNLNQVKWRVGLSQLEQAHALDYLGDARGVLMLRLRMQAEPDLRSGREMVEKRRTTKRAQLQAMIDYAEKDRCRRRVLLDHFGDRILADVPEPGQGEGKGPCCDVCTRKDSKTETMRRAESQAEWTALIILETVRTLGRDVGRQKIAQLLKGSRSQDLEKAGLTRHRFHGKLAMYSLDTINDFMVQLMDWGMLRVTGAEYPVVQITDVGKTALRNREGLPLSLPGAGTAKPKAKVQATSGVNSSVMDSANLIRQGLTPEQVAIRRTLSVETIYQHLARLIGDGKIALDEVVPPAIQETIRTAIAEVGNASLMNPIKQRVGDDISYGQIRCVIAALPRMSAAARASQPSSSTLPASTPASNAIGANSELFEALRAWRATLAQAQSVPTYVIFSDAVLYDIARRRPRSLDDLTQVKGVGPAKLTAYGDAILAIVSGF